MTHDRRRRFPLGSRVRLDAMSHDPYPVLKALQEQEPISWIAELEAWFVTRRADCLAILLESTTFSVASASSLLEDTLGQTMLSTDGARQRQLRQPFNGPFAPIGVRTHMAAPIAAYVHDLIDGFGARGQADLKTAFADRLALWTVMTVLGLPIDDFPTMRGWFTEIAHAASQLRPRSAGARAWARCCQRLWSLCLAAPATTEKEARQLCPRGGRLLWRALG
jgi:cytochrome P450